MTQSPLDALAAEARAQIQALGYPRVDWVPPRAHDTQPVIDVAIIGAGQSGLSIGLGLYRENVRNVVLFDRAGKGHEGPWAAFARMETLRTPKWVSGPETGIPALLPEAWYRARYGDRAWDDVERIPRAHWHEYVTWLHEVVDLPVRHATEVTDIEPRPDGLVAIHSRDVASGAAQPVCHARSVVLSSGIEGAGTWSVPDMVSDALPARLYAHTADQIDFAALRGRRVAVLGGGASAFDNAAMALEHGAEVEMFVRRPKLPPVNPYRWMEFTGFLRHFPDLPDDTKWAFMQRVFRMNQPPPQSTYDRCAIWKGFSIQYEAPVTALREVGDRIEITTPKGTHEADFLIVGTGMRVDFAARPELARIGSRVATWADRYDPAAGPEAYGLGDYPYLGDHFQLQGKNPQDQAAVSRIFCYTFAAMPSTGCSAGISALKFGAERVVRGITRQLFLEDAERHLENLLSFDEPELRPETAPAPALPENQSQSVA